ncbi:MAG: response regulator transcription factor [Chloroflexi bacterium]|nr:response regulator transcription factor [Chloroflexota bacterium]
MDRLRLLIVDDHPLVREGLKAMLAGEETLELVGEAVTGAEAVEKATELEPDVVLMDVRMPVMDGIEATRRIKEAHPALAVVMLTLYEHDRYVIEAVRAGASGYLLKDASRDLLVHTIGAAHTGVTLVKSSLLRRALEHGWGGSLSGDEAAETEGVGAEGRLGPPNAGMASHANAPGLTRRELEVLDLLAQGKTNKGIGQALWITEMTVKKHVASVIAKLGASNRSDAAVRAVRSGLVHEALGLSQDGF